ncbi:MAG: alpha/beta hydrolase [Treponema sp.]|nr:alpha/beta hydrolase [Treponema sp.]
MKLVNSLLLAGAVFALSTTACTRTKEATMADTTSAKIDRRKEHYTFKLAENVSRTTVTFRNHFGIELAGDLYTPKSAGAKGNAALAISGPFGAVKEQSSGFYANQMASRGYIALAFDPSYTGESGGQPRYMNSPDINTEDFMASVDFLSTRENIDPEKIGIIGICGWGGMALNAAAIDTRVKATVASTMYDMSRVTANGYFDSANSSAARDQTRKALMAQRIEDFKAISSGGAYKLAGGVIDPLPADAPYFVKDYHAYYKTPRGYHERSLNSNGGWALTASTSLLNTKLLAYSDEIESAVMVLHGEKAHSRYFGEDAFKRLTGDNKELVIVPGASHTDLYDGGEGDFIPFDKLTEFFGKYLR